MEMQSLYTSIASGTLQINTVDGSISASTDAQNKGFRNDGTNTADNHKVKGGIATILGRKCPSSFDNQESRIYLFA